METILIVEDDVDIRQLVSESMRHEGFDVEEAGDAEAMDAVLSRMRPDLMVLDLMLPGEDGLSICRRIRSRDHLPIVMLSAKSDEVDRVVGLEMGADDYVVKPFGLRELLARIRALLRRAHPQSAPDPSRRFAFDRFIVDLDSRQVATTEGQVVALTSAEFDLLACFVLRPRRVLSRDQICERIRGRSCDPLDRTVDMLVSRLRKKLLDAGVGPGTPLISTVRSNGYLLTSSVKALGGC